MIGTGLKPALEKNAALFDLSAWRYFMRAYRRHAKRLLVYAAIASSQSLLVLPVLFLVREAFDTAIPNGNVSLLIWFAVGIILARLISSALVLLMRRMIIRSIKAAVTDMRQGIVAKLYALSRRFHSTKSIDDVHTQVVQDTERVDIMSNALFSGILPAAITSTILFAVLLVLNWQLTALTLLVFPLVTASTWISGKYVKRNVFQFQRAFESFSKGMMFVLRQIDLTRIQGQEEREKGRQAETLNQLRDSGEQMAFSYALHRQVQTNVFGLSGLIILVVGGMSIANGSMTMGEFVAFYMAAGLLSGQVSSVIGGVPDIITGNESLVTLETLMRDEDLEPYTGTREVACQGHIALKNIDFAYDEALILKNVSLTIKPDSNLVIVGPNGAGKSTIVSLILGFWKPDAGEILIEGVSLNEIDIKYFRRSVGVVMQHPVMFAGSVFENIAYGFPDAAQEEVEAAAKLAHAHDFIADLSDGYETQVGDGGALLSGGERQKIAIARVLLGKPKFVIFDEPTNHLDTASIRAILGNIHQSGERPAILTISHDPTVIGYGDEVYELNSAELVRLENTASKQTDPVNLMSARG